MADPGKLPCRHDSVPISKHGAGEVRRFFDFLASQFSDCTAYRFEAVAAGVSGDLAYTVGYEHTAVSIDGAPVEPYSLRVTHVYRREDGAWKIVHPPRRRPSGGGNARSPGR